VRVLCGEHPGTRVGRGGEEVDRVNAPCGRRGGGSGSGGGDGEEGGEASVGRHCVLRSGCEGRRTYPSTCGAASS
jgi:hypothetical protein